MQKYLSIFARIFLALIFLVSGFGKIFAFGGTQEYMAAYGMPATAFFLIGAIILEIGGGTLLLTGIKPRWGALALILFLIPATLIFHTDFADRLQMVQFLKNLALLGGLLLFVVNGNGIVDRNNRTKDEQALDISASLQA